MRLRTLFAALGLFLAMGTVGVAPAAAATTGVELTHCWYRSDGNPKWHAETQGSAGAWAVFQSDGRPKWHAGTQGSPGA